MTETSPILIWRKKAGLDQAEAAILLKTTQATISRYESGLQRPHIERLDDISRVTGIEREKLRPDIFRSSVKKRRT